MELLKSLHLLKYCIITCCLSAIVQGDYATDVSNLIDSLKLNYNTEVRPQNKTDIFTTLFLFALNSLNIEMETMELSGMIYAIWTDRRLSWNRTTTNINQIFVKPSTIWTPPLIIENEITKVGIIGSEDAPLRVYSNGTIAWYPLMSTKTSCSADITYYPYDIQTCTLTMTGWSYSTDEVYVYTDLNNPVLATHLISNGEWDILTTSARYEDIVDDHELYRKTHFGITFRRKWPYYAQSTILPIILNSVLMAVVFAVPIESGEKMGYCLTVQLSYIVLLTMVSEDLPSISSQTSVIQLYLSIVLCIGTACIVCTTCILRIYNHDESDPVPWWLQTLTKYILAPMVCTRCTRKKKVQPKEDSGGPLDTYSCKEIAKILDKFFFRLFVLILVMTSCSFVGVLWANYNKE